MTAKEFMQRTCQGETFFMPLGTAKVFKQRQQAVLAKEFAPVRRLAVSLYTKADEIVFIKPMQLGHYFVLPCQLPAQFLTGHC